MTRQKNQANYRNENNRYNDSQCNKQPGWHCFVFRERKPGKQKFEVSGLEVQKRIEFDSRNGRVLEAERSPIRFVVVHVAGDTQYNKHNDPVKDIG